MAGAATQLELASVEDAVPIARLSRDEIEHGLEWRWQPPAILRLIARPETAVLCARCRFGGASVLGGFGVMEFGLERAHLVLLAVAPRLRRRGVARQILAWLEKSADTAGVGEISWKYAPAITAHASSTPRKATATATICTASIKGAKRPTG